MSRKSSVIFNTREQILSSDINRVQTLDNRETMDWSKDNNRGDSERAAGSDGDTTLVQPGGATNRFQRVPVWGPNTGNMTSNVGEGEMHIQGTGTGDESTYKVLRWIAEIITLAPSDPADPRIDLVVATVGEQSTDASSRTILVDPVTRVTAPAMVNKTKNPKATLAVLTGTPAAVPVPPIPSATQFVLFEVFVPATITNAAAADATRPVPAGNVRLESAMHGIIQGLDFFPGLGDDFLVPDPLGTDFRDAGLCRVIINGELITFKGGHQFPANAKMLFTDILADPFAGAAPAANDKVYYMYAVGGRSMPDSFGGSFGGGSSVPDVPPDKFFSIRIVESITQPQADGRPSAVIGLPGGGTTQEGALYIGVGYVIQGTTRRKRVQWIGDQVWAKDGQKGTGTVSGDQASFSEPDQNSAPGPGVFGVDYTLATRPNLSTWARIVPFIAAAAGTPSIGVKIGPSGVGGAQIVYRRQFESAGTAANKRAQGGEFFELPLAPFGGVDMNLFSLSIETDFTTNMFFMPTAYNMRVNRYGR